MVSYGAASGPVPPLDITKLSAKGSLFVTRPTMATYVNARQDIVDIAKAVFDAILDGTVKIHINQRYPLRDAVQAHRAIENRTATGSSIMVP